MLQSDKWYIDETLEWFAVLAEYGVPVSTFADGLKAYIAEGVDGINAVLAGVDTSLRVAACRPSIREVEGLYDWQFTAVN